MLPAEREGRIQPSLYNFKPMRISKDHIGGRLKTPWDSALLDWVPRQQSADRLSPHLAPSLFEGPRNVESGPGASTWALNNMPRPLTDSGPTLNFSCRTRRAFFGIHPNLEGFS